MANTRRVKERTPFSLFSLLPETFLMCARRGESGGIGCGGVFFEAVAEC